MEHLADLIRKGLATKSVVEDKYICGAGMEGNKCHASITGLALIGKIGIKEACELFETAMEEGVDGPCHKRILKELKVKAFLLENMVAAHFTRASAEEIAMELETGVFVV